MIPPFQDDRGVADPFAESLLRAGRDQEPPALEAAVNELLALPVAPTTTFQRTLFSVGNSASSMRRWRGGPWGGLSVMAGLLLGGVIVISRLSGDGAKVNVLPMSVSPAMEATLASGGGDSLPPSAAVDATPAAQATELTTARTMQLSLPKREATKSDDLAREISIVERARGALRAQNPELALSTLTQYQRDFPHGHLHEEASVVRVQALSKRGDQRGALRSAKKFLTTYPDSPYAPSVAALVGLQEP